MSTKKIQRVLLLLAVVVSWISAQNMSIEQCPDRKFGDRCRFDCKCQLSTSCDREKGTCFYGCLPKHSGPGCQISELSGGASQSYTKPQTSERKCIRRDYYNRCQQYNTIYTSYDASLARTADKCAKIHSGTDRWWRLDLQGDYVVTGLDFQVNGPVDIRVGPVTGSTVNPLCTSALSGTHNVTCRPARRGRYVYVKFTSAVYEYGATTDICKVHVRGYKYNNYCPWGRFGPACLRQCTCMIENERCHHVDGSCPSGCQAAKIGYGCDLDFQMTAGVEVAPVEKDVIISIPDFKHKTDSQRGEVNVSYILEIMNEAWREVTKEPGARSIRVTDLKPYARYRVRVTLARRSVGNIMVRGPPGPETNFTSPCGEPAKGPEIKMIETDIANLNEYPSRINATVFWKPVSNDHANCARVDRYKLNYRRAFDAGWSVYPTDLRAASDTVVQTLLTGLKPMTVYEFRMIAVNEPNLEKVGHVVASQTPDGVLGPVMNVTLDVTSTTASLDWDAPNDTEAQATLLGFRVKYNEYEVMACSKIRNPARSKVVKTSEISLRDLKPYRKYNVSVCALSSAKCGPEVVKDILTEGQAPTTKPAQAAVAGILARSARVKFQHLPCHLRFGQFKNFSAQLSLNGKLAETFKTEQTVHDIKDLTPNSAYELKYSWVNEFGQSPFSDIVAFTTAIDVPGPPKIINYVSTPGSVALLWKPPSVTNGDLTEYESSCSLPGVQRLVARQLAKEDEEDEMFHVFSGGIMPKRLYRCKVRAYTSSGAGQWSTVANIITTYKNDLEPRNFNASIAEDNSSLTCQWEEPLITNGILGYKLQCAGVNDTEPLFQKNLFVGKTEYTFETDDKIEDDLSCELSTHLVNGKGESVSTVVEAE